MKKLKTFINNNYALISAVLAIIAILFLFLPIFKYEIRESVYDLVSGERVSKTDYTYSMNLVSFFSTGFKLNYTMHITLMLIILGAGFAIGGRFKKELLAISSMVYLLSICMIFLSKEFFQSEENCVMDFAPIVGNYNPDTQSFSASLHGASLSFGSALGIVFLSLALFFSVINNEKATTRQIAEEGVLIALAFVLNLVKIPIGATGGSINLQMLPLMIIALRYGPTQGFFAGGIIYGLLTCLTDGYGFACYPFDYLIGFGSVSIMGLFRNQIFGKNQKGYNIKGLLFIFLSGLLSTLIRYIGSNTSSIVVYGYTLEAALAYNAFYIPLSGLIATVGFMILYDPLIRVNKLYPVKLESNKKAEETSATESK